PSGGGGRSRSRVRVMCWLAMAFLSMDGDGAQAGAPPESQRQTLTSILMTAASRAGAAGGLCAGGRSWAGGLAASSAAPAEPRLRTAVLAADAIALPMDVFIVFSWVIAARRGAHRRHA